MTAVDHPSPAPILTPRSQKTTLSPLASSPYSFIARPTPGLDVYGATASLSFGVRPFNNLSRLWVMCCYGHLSPDPRCDAFTVQCCRNTIATPAPTCRLFLSSPTKLLHNILHQPLFIRTPLRDVENDWSVFREHE